VANRSYVYTFDRFEAGMPWRPRGVHHWASAFPLSELLLLSGRPRAYQSSLYDRAKVAVV